MTAPCGLVPPRDAGVVRPDRYAEIRDRIKDLIIRGGENISTVEVEGVLLRHRAVAEVAIVGLAHEKWGEAPYAFVVHGLERAGGPGHPVRRASIDAGGAGGARVNYRRHTLMCSTCQADGAPTAFWRSPRTPPRCAPRTA